MDDLLEFAELGLAAGLIEAAASLVQRPSTDSGIQLTPEVAEALSVVRTAVPLLTLSSLLEALPT